MSTPPKTDRDQKRTIAQAAHAYGQRRLSRRDFLRICAGAGLGFSTAGLLAACGPGQPAAAPDAGQLATTAGPASASQTTSDAATFLQDVGRPFAGTTLRVVTELTPPSGRTSLI